MSLSIQDLIQQARHGIQQYREENWSSGKYGFQPGSLQDNRIEGIQKLLDEALSKIGDTKMPLTQFAFKENETTWKELTATVLRGEYVLQVRAGLSTSHEALRNLLNALYKIVPKEMLGPAAQDSSPQDSLEREAVKAKHGILASEREARSEGAPDLNSPREAVGQYILAQLNNIAIYCFNLGLDFQYTITNVSPLKSK